MAKMVGMSVELELAALHRALTLLPEIDGYLSVNISPETILNCDLEAELAGYPLKRVVLELTEHSAIDNYDEIETSLSRLRAQGLSVAIDDAGSGYASLRHILMLKPDMVKIDQSITRGIDSHSGRQAMASAFRGFATRIGCALVAEGVETQEERRALEFIGIPHSQGYFFGRPQPRENLPGNEPANHFA
jgi:EAL domain-containing protein (putative c-di-GMP-specific phosphodiesterase class I)